MHRQFDRSPSNTGPTSQKVPLSWDVFLTPGIPAITSALPPGEKERHKRVGNDDSPKLLGETRKYIRDFGRLAMQTTTAQELYDQMLKLYPDWGNRGALWSSVRATKS